jgi:sec-independent protein translocase protein TatC
MAVKPSYQFDPEPEQATTDGRMGFLEHLDELRKRIIVCCIALASGMFVAFFFVERIADFVLAPTFRALPADTNLIMTRPGEGLSFYLDLALMGGFLCAAPVITYQVWQFIAPGLYSRERRLVLPLVLLACLGTLSGAAFTHYILFPSMMSFLQSFDSPRMQFMPRVEDTFELYRNMLLGMVAVFQIPTLVLFLARLRMVTARFLWQQLRYAILVSFVAAALLTPSPDPWNQAMFAAPMIGLYVISIGIAYLAAPRKQAGSEPMSANLKLVFAATVLEQAARTRDSRRVSGNVRVLRRTR